MNKPLECVQIGVGGQGRHWCDAVVPRLMELGLAVPVAAVDIDPEILPNAKTYLGLSDNQLYTSAEQALAEQKPDFINIVVPPAHHEEFVNLAVEHGCHILSEKPIADTMDACCRIYHKVKKAGLKMAVTMTHRFDQDKQTLERELKSGKYGELSSLIGRNSWDCRKYGRWGHFRHDIPDTLLIEGTVHHFDIIRALTGADAKTLYAVTWNPPWGEFAGDSNGLIILTMQNGVQVFYEGNKTSATATNNWRREYFRAECDLATLELDNRELRVMSDLSGERVVDDVPLLEQPAWCNPWLAETFVHWLNGGDPPPNSLDDNIQCCALLFAAIESSHTGNVIDVQDFLQTNLRAVAD